MLNKTFFIALLFLPILAAAQSLPANITLSSGTVLTGRVEYKDWKKTPDRVLFIAPSKQKQVYSVSGIQQIGLTFPDGSYTLYKTFVVQYDTSDQRLQALDLQSAGEWKQDTVLLQYVYSGRFKLFSFSNTPTKTHLFIQSKDSTPVELLKKTFRRNDAPGRYFVNYAYRKQLSDLLKDCPDVASQTFKLAYYSAEITEILRKYDACMGAAPGKDFRIKKPALAISLLAGVDFTKPNTDRLQPAHATINTKPGWSAGARVEYFFPGRQRRWAYQGDFLYNRFNAAYQTNTGAVTIGLVKLSESGDFYRVNNMVKLGSSDLKQRRIWLGTGVSLSKTPKRVIVREKFYTTGQFAYTDEIVIPKAPIEAGLLFGSGFQRGRLGIELRYEHIFGQLVGSSRARDIYPPRVFAAHLMLSYQLTKPVLWR